MASEQRPAMCFAREICKTTMKFNSPLKLILLIELDKWYREFKVQLYATDNLIFLDVEFM